MIKNCLTSLIKSQAVMACVLLFVVFAASAGAVESDSAPAAERTVGKEAVKRDSANRLVIPENAEDVVPGDIKTQEDFLPDLKEQAPIVPAYSIWRVVFGLFFVIGLILLITYLLRAMSNRGLRLDIKGRHIRVIDNIQLGVNRTLFLVQIGAKIILLSSNDKGLSYLTEVTDPDDIKMFLTEGSPPATETTFTGQLRGAVARGGNRTPGGASGSASGTSAVDKLKERLTKLSDEK